MFEGGALKAAVAAHGRVARVVIAGHEGSSPRETGAAMLVWEGGQSGTVGGGALEFQAVEAALSCLKGRPPGLARIALGPRLGQCCGGAVSLLTEVFTPVNLPPEAPLYARSIDGRPMPLAVRRLIAAARGQGRIAAPQMLQGWMVEPMSQPLTRIWVWGAGHVGRAIVGVLAPLPGAEITWVDIAPERFPDPLAAGVRSLVQSDPPLAVTGAPPEAHHLILTYSHQLDLELCHRLLGHGFASCGLIGSATKWARFRARLAALGHGQADIARIICPIGDPALGKHPQAIAIGVAARLLRGDADACVIPSRTA